MSTRRVVRRTFKHEILNSVLSETLPELLYHYTDQNGLMGIVKSKEIWATHHQCLNDTQEFLHAKALFRDEIDRRCESASPDSRSVFESMRSGLGGQGNEDVNLYIASFSEDGDSLPQWRAYGGQTAGFALAFWGDRLALPEDFTTVRCIYEPKKQCEVAKAIVEEIEHTLDQMALAGPTNQKFTAWAGLLLTLHQFALIFKHEKFKEEKEWRIVPSHPLMDFKPAFPVGELENKLDFRPGRSMLIPYRRVPLKDNKNNFPLPLSEVVIGPNPNKEQSGRSVQSLLNSQGQVVTKVRTSTIPYRNW